MKRCYRDCPNRGESQLKRCAKCEKLERQKKLLSDAWLLDRELKRKLSESY